MICPAACGVRVTQTTMTEAQAWRKAYEASTAREAEGLSATAARSASRRRPRAELSSDERCSAQC